MKQGDGAILEFTSKRTRRERFFPLILGLIVIARLGFASLVYQRPQLAIANDSDRYIPIANAIIKGQAYGWNTSHPGELLNTIGYPLFLAGVFLTLGRNPGDVALAQLLVTGSVAIISYKVLSRRMRAASVFLASALLALDPLTILWSMTVLTEALFAAALGISAVMLVVWAHSKERVTLGLAGLFLALASLVKPLALLIVALWLVGLAFFPVEHGGAPLRRLAAVARRGAIFALPSLVLVGPWFVRNALLWNCPTLASVDRVTMRDYMAAKVLAEAQHQDLGVVQAQLQETDPGVCPREAPKYFRIILDHPAIYARLHAAGTVPVLIATNFDRWLKYSGAEYTVPDLWRPFLDAGWTGLASVLAEQSRQFPQAMRLMVGLSGYQLLLYVLALAGVIAAFRRSTGVAQWTVLVLVAAIAILILMPGQGGHERFRVPVQPLLAILMAYRGAGLVGRTDIRVMTAET